MVENFAAITEAVIVGVTVINQRTCGQLGTVTQAITVAVLVDVQGAIAITVN